MLPKLCHAAAAAAAAPFDGLKCAADQTCDRKILLKPEVTFKGDLRWMHVVCGDVKESGSLSFLDLVKFEPKWQKSETS